MKTYFYKAVNKQGEIVEGEKTGESKEAISTEIASQGLTAIYVEEKTGRKLFSNISFSFGRVKEQDLIVFARNLGKMIASGLPVVRALEIMEKQAKEGKFKKVLVDINDGVSKGKTISECLSEHKEVFSTLFVSMVRAGEESGNLSESLEIVSGQMERTYILKKKIKGAMMYPGIILFAMILIATLMLIFVVPTLTATFKGLGVDLPMSTKIIIYVSEFINNNLLLTLFAVICVVVLGGMYFRTKNGKRVLDYVFLKTPLIGDITKKVNSARTARTLSSLLSSGVEYTIAVGITEDVLQNSYYKSVLKEAGEVIVKGGSISEIFSSRVNLYPLYVSEMAKVGEETGKLSEMLLEVAKFYEEEVEQKTKDMSTVIEPFLMILIGGAVGFFALSMMSPMYSLADKI